MDSCLTQSQKMLKLSHDAAMTKVDELSVQLKDERLKSLDMEKNLQTAAVSSVKTEQVLTSVLCVRPPVLLTPHRPSPLLQLQERISELEQERDLLKEDNDQLLSR